MEFKAVRPDVVKYEMRMISGEDPFAVQQKKPGFFGRLLSGVGKFFGAVAAPMSLIFPPAAIGAAGMYGIGQIGDQMQQKAYMKQMANQPQGQSISYPGLDLSQSSSGNYQPVSATGLNVTQSQDATMDLLFARNDAMLDSAHKV